MTGAKIVFLDIDGVLKTTASDYYWSQTDDFKATKFCPICCSNLNYLLKELSDWVIVLTSSWRLGFNISEMRELFRANRLPAHKLVDYTPYIQSAPRFTEIQTYLDNSVCTDWLILDDESMGPLSDHQIKMDKLIGLSWKDVKQGIHYYKRG